jgi:hypothetical protein
MEETKCLKPSDSGSRNTVTARDQTMTASPAFQVYNPQAGQPLAAARRLIEGRYCRNTESGECRHVDFGRRYSAVLEQTGRCGRPAKTRW